MRYTIDARVKAGGLLREQAEAQVSGLLSDIWTEAERTLRRLPGRVFLDPTQEKRSA